MNNVPPFDHNKLIEFSSHSALFFAGDELIVNATNYEPLLPLKETLSQLNAQIENAYFCDPVVIVKCHITQNDEALFKVHLKRTPIKPFLIHTQPNLQMLILKAYHWLNWDKQSRYCGQCGNPLENQFAVTEKRCTHCNCSFFPRFSPAVMIIIQKDDEILLARSKHFTPGVYSAIAGFVDVGESAEMAAHREVKEEVGIEITDLRYFATQTWPFPDSFMIAFKANYVRGKVSIDHNELEDARWFSINALPSLPMKLSIARRLIDSVIEAQH